MKTKGKSEKLPVVERLFAQLPRNRAGRILNTEVKLSDVKKAIRWCKKNGHPITLSEDNPANFFKDIIRRDDADSFWPRSVFAAGYSARQVTGGKRVFEFVRVPKKQKIPFPNPYYPSKKTLTHKVQSISLSIASKLLGRSDETWMTQVLVKLDVVATHFAIFSPRARRVIHADHLQMGIKRRGAEIDALFMGVERNLAGDECFTLITFEAKKQGERIIHEQIERQVTEAIKMSAKKPELPRFEFIIPCGIKALGDSRVYLIEFNAVQRDAWPTSSGLKMVREVIYEFEPAVPGL